MSGVLAGKVAIVTGGGWNIGRTVARAFATAGARVAVASRRQEKLEETVEQILAAGGDAIAVPTDVTLRSQVEQMVARTVQRFGTVDVLAAIAGGGAVHGAIDTVDPDEWERCVAVNLFSTFLCARAVLPLLRQKNAGNILTCAGGGAFFPMVGVLSTAYASAKAGVCRFTDQLAAELLDTGIRVNGIEPGRVPGEGEEALGLRNVAELATWLASKQSEPLTGRIIAAAEDWWRDPEKVWYAHHTEHYYRLRRFVP